MSAWITPREAAEAIEGGNGAGVRVAVLDSGIEIGHPDFAGRSLRDDLLIDPADDSRGDRSGGGVDPYGHGTALAGIIWRLAPAAEIGSFRVLGPDLSARSAAIALGARAAIRRGYQVLNCSFACVIPGHLPIYKEWIDEAALAGVHVVAAGNGSSLRPEWPAHFTSVLATDSLGGAPDDLTLHYQAGHPVAFRAGRGAVEVPWRDGGRRVMTGGSFAAAHLSGLLARLLSRHPLRDGHQVQALLARVGESSAR